MTKHGDVKYVIGEGMPQYKNPFEKGRLIIQFLVNFPTSLPAEVIPSLEACLPARYWLTYSLIIQLLTSAQFVKQLTTPVFIFKIAAIKLNF